MRKLIFLAALLCSSLAQAVELDLSPYKGKVVYVDLWASWCPPCRASFPWMEKLHQDLKDKGLVVLAVNTGDDPEDAARFLEMHKPTFEIITDAEGEIFTQLGAISMPFSVIYNRKGERVSAHSGFTKKDAPAQRQAIEAQLAETN